jgi:hypothetical protein
MQQVGLNVKNAMVIKRLNAKIVMAKGQNTVMIVQEQEEKSVIGAMVMVELIVMNVAGLGMTVMMIAVNVTELANQIALTVLVGDLNNVIPVMDHQKRTAIHAMVQVK